MSIGKKIKNKASEFLKNFEEEDPFGVTIDDCDGDEACTEKNEGIPPGDDGYGD